MKKGEVSINKNDIIGKKVGLLEVIGYAGCWHDDTKGGKRMRHRYTCRCQCGTVKQIQRGELLNEIVYSCGCIRRRHYVNKGKKQHKQRCGLL